MVALGRLIRGSSHKVLMGLIGVLVATQAVRILRRLRSASVVAVVAPVTTPLTSSPGSASALESAPEPDASTADQPGPSGAHPEAVSEPSTPRRTNPFEDLSAMILAGYRAHRAPASAAPASDAAPTHVQPPAYTPAGVLVALTRWCIGHRRWVVLGWVALAIATNVIVLVVGRDYRNDYSLPGTQAQDVVNLLNADFPAQSGDVDEIVFHYSDGRYNATAVRAALDPLLKRVSTLPYVASVTSPFTTAGAIQVSTDDHTAFAVVHFSRAVDRLPDRAGRGIIRAVRTVHVPGLQIAAGGQAIEQAEGYDIGAATAVGVIAALVILLVTFGSLITAGMPLLSAGFGLLVGFALVGISSQIASVAPLAPDMALMIGLGVGVDYALFIVTRFRENYARSGDIELAILEAMDTSGRAILLAGSTVIIALLGMIATGIAFMFGLAVASILAVLLVLMASLTVLPALLSWWGPRVVQPTWFARRRASGAGATRPSAWRAWSLRVQSYPKLLTVASLAVMVALGMPYFSARFESADAGTDPPNSTTKAAYDLIAKGFGPGFNGPLEVAVVLKHGAQSVPALKSVSATLAKTVDIGAVTSPMIAPNKSVAVLFVFPNQSPQASVTESLVNHLRNVIDPALQAKFSAKAPISLLVGGFTAASIDFAQVLDNKLPLFIAIVVALSALLLFVMFRSILIPIQAGVMNLLSIGGAIGATVLVFQDGWFATLFGVTPGPIEPWIPVMLFAVVFGLSMDYEVFLISRVREEWIRRRNSSAAVADGIANTGRVITAAAAIMVCVFLSFVLGDQRAVKEFGFGLAVAVFLDALVVRCVMLPAMLELFGRWTWWLPRWVDRYLPHINIEGNAALAEEAARAELAAGVGELTEVPAGVTVPADRPTVSV